MILVRTMYDRFKDWSQRTEIISIMYRDHSHYRPPPKTLSTEKTSEKVTSKSENDTSSKESGIQLTKLSYFWRYGKDNLMGFVAKHPLKTRNGTNVLNAAIKKRKRVLS